MQRSFSSWGVTALGLALAGGGVYAMSTGWDMILLERGWSLFIAGSVALSGGVVTVALGRVIAQIARLGSQVAIVSASTQDATFAPPALGDSVPRSATEADPYNPPSRFEEEPEQAFTEDAAARSEAPAPQPPSEVDRYTAGGATYVMMSDGSVEVHSASGMQRYPSLAAVRARAQALQR